MFKTHIDYISPSLQIHCRGEYHVYVVDEANNSVVSSDYLSHEEVYRFAYRNRNAVLVLGPGALTELMFQTDVTATKEG